MGKTKVLFLDKNSPNYPKELPKDIETSYGAYVQDNGIIDINTVFEEVERKNGTQTYTLEHEVSI